MTRPASDREARSITVGRRHGKMAAIRAWMAEHPGAVLVRPGDGRDLRGSLASWGILYDLCTHHAAAFAITPIKAAWKAMNAPKAK